MDDPFLSCGLCSSRFEELGLRIPLRLPNCCHSYCCQCLVLRESVDKNGQVCPTCRSPFEGVDSLKPNVAIIQLLSASPPTIPLSLEGSFGFEGSTESRLDNGIDNHKRQGKLEQLLSESAQQRAKVDTLLRQKQDLDTRLAVLRWEVRNVEQQFVAAELMCTEATAVLEGMQQQIRSMESDAADELPPLLPAPILGNGSSSIHSSANLAGFPPGLSSVANSRRVRGPDGGTSAAAAELQEIAEQMERAERERFAREQEERERVKQQQLDEERWQKESMERESERERAAADEQRKRVASERTRQQEETAKFETFERERFAKLYLQHQQVLQEDSGIDCLSSYSLTRPLKPRVVAWQGVPASELLAAEALERANAEQAELEVRQITEERARAEAISNSNASAESKSDKVRKAEREAAEWAAMEELQRQNAERAAKEKAERLDKERKERERVEKQRAEKDARAKQHREQADKAERERIEREVREKKEREAKVKADKERKEREALDLAMAEAAEERSKIEAEPVVAPSPVKKKKKPVVKERPKDEPFKDEPGDRETSIAAAKLKDVTPYVRKNQTVNHDQDSHGHSSVYEGEVLFVPHHRAPSRHFTIDHGKGIRNTYHKGVLTKALDGEWRWGEFVRGTIRKIGKFTYTGECQGEVLQGRGVLRHENGLTLAGEFVAGNINGEGKMRSSDGSTYTGSFRDGEFEGHGRYEKPGVIFEGEFRKGLRDGTGKMELSDGTKYEGSFKAGFYSGQGNLTRPDGMEYTGHFLDDQFDGEGLLVSPGPASTFIYTGTFRAGFYEGQGALEQVGVMRYVGEFRDGRYHGLGVCTTVAGVGLECTWDAGKPAKDSGVRVILGGSEMQGRLEVTEAEGENSYAFIWLDPTTGKEQRTVLVS